MWCPCRHALPQAALLSTNKHVDGPMCGPIHVYRQRLYIIRWAAYKLN